MLLETVVLIICLCQYTNGACENTLSSTNRLTIRDENGKVLDVLEDCETLFAKHPILCKGDVGKANGQCCKLCRANRDQLKCIDNTLRRFDGKYCADYVKEDPCNCDDKQLQVRKHCCASCKDKVCPKCRDYLSKTRYIEIKDLQGKTTRLTNCKTLIMKYLYLCKKQYGKDGGHCCESCSKEDLSCVDEGVKYVVNDKRLSCAQYIAGDPCRCEDNKVKRDCCKSCENAVCDPCRDYLSVNSWLEVTKPDGKKEKLTNCKTLVRKYLSLCKKYGAEGKQCCKSCSGKNLDCVDDSLRYYTVNGKRLSCAQYIKQDPCNCERASVQKACCASCKKANLKKCICEDSPTWRTTVQMSKTDKCVRCTCAEIKAKGLSWMRKACQPKNSSARKKCCKSCTALGYPPK